MQILYCNDMPCIVFDGVLSDEEASIFGQIIDSQELVSGDALGSAIDAEGNTKTNKGVWLGEFSPNNTFDLPTKFIGRLLNNAIEYCPHWVWRYALNSSHVSCLASYYEEGDEYPQHFDLSKVTMLLWLHKGAVPEFIGGDLVLEDGQVIAFKNNRAVLFPSVLEHSVTKVRMKFGETSGRYCFTGFFN